MASYKYSTLPVEKCCSRNAIVLVSLYAILKIGIVAVENSQLHMYILTGIFWRSRGTSGIIQITI